MLLMLGVNASGWLLRRYLASPRITFDPLYHIDPAIARPARRPFLTPGDHRFPLPRLSCGGYRLVVICTCDMQTCDMLHMFGVPFRPSFANSFGRFSGFAPLSRCLRLTLVFLSSTLGALLPLTLGLTLTQGISAWFVHVIICRCVRAIHNGFITYTIFSPGSTLTAGLAAPFWVLGSAPPNARELLSILRLCGLNDGLVGAIVRGSTYSCVVTQIR